MYYLILWGSKICQILLVLFIFKGYTSFVNYMFCKYFPSSWVCILIFKAAFWRTEVLSLDEVQFIDIFFLSQFMIFYVLLKKSLLNPRSLRFFLMLLFRNIIYLTLFHIWKEIVCLEGIIWPLWGWYSIHGWLQERFLSYKTENLDVVKTFRFLPWHLRVWKTSVD